MTTDHHLIVPVCGNCRGEIDKDESGWWHVGTRPDRPARPESCDEHPGYPGCFGPPDHKFVRL